ncbi:glycine C-acetyltransferase [Flavobacteriaceae bacterium]|jgi:glycine C-acetyltransferase|nr:glycine C-acetyltransferase [Flavobacteriaceae bacterium]MDC3246134.1 glycine C-acetyltransferase [Flavobacteriaceae bacterium]
MYESIQKRLIKELDEVKISGRFKSERVIESTQKSEISVNNNKVLNFCANNYLGLASNKKVIARAKETLDSHGFGMASVRFICGTQDIHKQLENKISEFLDKEDTILYAAAFDANGGLFEPLFNDQDAIISDELNHASIIDGIRLCKAKRFRYKHNDMKDLEKQLINTKDLRNRIIVTDGVFSMDGTIAQLDKICELAIKYDALVMSDECHSTGFIGPTGKGVPEELGVMDKVDIITGTLGKALGGASGGFTSGPKEIIELLRQKSRPYLFSNTLAPSIVGASLGVLELLNEDDSILKKLKDNTEYFRDKILSLGFEIKPGSHPIVPVMLYDDHLAQKMSAELLKLGIYVIGFFFPVVPKGQARIRVQISAAHSKEDIDKALNSFYKVGKELGVI